MSLLLSLLFIKLRLFRQSTNNINASSTASSDPAASKGVLMLWF